MRGDKYANEALVHWKKLPVEDSTWEEVNQLRHQCPSLNLKDKVPGEGGTNDRPRRLRKPNPKNMMLEKEQQCQAVGTTGTVKGKCQDGGAAGVGCCRFEVMQ
jgi:hypothetical protein